MNKAQLCRCNNCMEVFIDKNPSEQPELPIPFGTGELKLMRDSGDFYYGCPNCETDDYLTDLYEEEE